MTPYLLHSIEGLSHTRLSTWLFLFLFCIRLGPAVVLVVIISML